MGGIGNMDVESEWIVVEVFLLSCTRSPLMSRDIPAEQSFLCDKAAVPRDTIGRTACTITASTTDTVLSYYMRMCKECIPHSPVIWRQRSAECNTVLNL